MFVEALSEEFPKIATPTERNEDTSVLLSNFGVKNRGLDDF